MAEKNFPEKYLEALKKLRLIDDAFFSAFFDDNAKDVEYILRIILDKSDLKVLKVQTQKSVENIYGRSVRFDVFATDDKNKLYNIEVQRADAGAIPTRARYNSAMLDYHNVNKNEKFKEMPETFVIFITEHDVLEDGEQIYHVERMILETKKIFPDREHIIYVNGSYKDESGSELGDLVHDFFCENPADMRHRQLAERVKFLKDNKSGVRKMCKIIEDLFAEDLAEGKKETLLDSIRNLMETMKWSSEQAMDALKIPIDKQNEYRPLI